MVTTSAFGATPDLSVEPRTDAPSVGFSLIPKAFQRRPQLDFNVLTEMTDEGRKLAPPTPATPVYYAQRAGVWVSTGSATVGKQTPPPVAELEAAMQKALASSGYLPGEPPAHQPALAIIFTYGTHAIDPQVPPDLADDSRPPLTSADDLLPLVLNNGTLYADLLERAALIAGPKFAADLKRALAQEIDNINANSALSAKTSEPGSRDPNMQLPVSPNARSPYQLFVTQNPKVTYLVETAFHTCYFVVASAYDYAAMSKGEKRLLWRTKMTVDAQGVSMRESFAPLIATAAPFLGRDMAEVAIVSRRISREGKVEIGEATVVESDVKAAVPRPAPPASKEP